MDETSSPKNSPRGVLKFLFVVPVLTVFALWILCGGDWSILTDSSDIRWLVGGDRSFGFLGWLDFLRHPWPIPLNTSSHYLYPLPSNIALTDSVPILAVIAKIFAPKDFTIWHPYGYWLISVFGLQALFGYLLACRVLAQSFLLRLAFTMIVTTAAPIYYRNGHMALMSHWILLASFVLSTATQAISKASNYIMWTILTFVAATIHPYWPPMVLVIAGCVFFYTSWKLPDVLSYKATLLRLIGLVCAALFGFWLLGIMGQPKPIDELHIYTSDILIHLNPYGWSQYLPPLFKFRSGQYEGFAYVGAGVLFILLMFVFRSRLPGANDYPFKKWISPSPELVGLSLGCLCLFVWSLGAKVRLLGQTMGYLDFLYEPLLPILGTFRSVGRFAWAMHYFIVLVAFAWLSHLWSAGRKKQAIIMAILAILFQSIETVDKAGRFFVREAGFRQLDHREWEPLLEGKTTINLIPPEIAPTSCSTIDHNIRPWLPVALIAVERGMKFNSGARANPPESEAKAYCESVASMLASGKFDPDAAYAVPPWADRSWLAKLTVWDKLKCQQLSDGYTVCI